MGTSRRVFLQTIASMACAGGIWAAGHPALAAETSVTTIYVKDMHCETCAKKIAGKLYTLPGVTQVKTHVKKGTAMIVSHKDKPVSPKAAWEAIEAVSFEPIRVATPRGTFDKKPRF